jgi:hypothetical protein
MVISKSGSFSALFGLALAWGLTVAAPSANAAMVFNLVDQLDGTVKLNYSGFVTTSDLSLDGTSGNAGNFITPNQGQIRKGGSVDLYDTGSTTPLQLFGTGVKFDATAASGSAIRFNWADPLLVGVPSGYVSGTAISGSMDFSGSLATLGLTAGTYSFNWGVGGAGRSATLNISAAQVSEPGSLALVGLAALGMAFRGRRKIKA